MAENVLDSGPPSAKRPKLSSPALSASASDGNGKDYSLKFRLNSDCFICSFPCGVNVFVGLYRHVLVERVLIFCFAVASKPRLASSEHRGLAS